MKLSKLMLYQVCNGQNTDKNQTDEIISNLDLLTKAIRNPSAMNADRIVIPFLPNGISVAVETSNHYLIDHYIHVPLQMDIVSPISLYLKNMNNLPPDLVRFCDISEGNQAKFLQSHINSINSLWTQEIEGYESFMTSGKHKRAVIQGLLTIILMTYHISNYFIARHDHDQYQKTIDDLTSKIHNLSDSNRLILMGTEDILSLTQSYFCDSAKKFSKVQDTLAKQLVKDYIHHARLTIENAINNRLPLTSDVNHQLTSLCEALNEQNAHLCSIAIIRGMTSSFHGLSTTVDDFGSSIIHIHTSLQVPIFAYNQFVSRLNIGNIGFYVNDKRKKLDLPQSAFILNHTDLNLPENTPMITDCDHINCKPISQIDTLTPNLCLGALITLNSTKVATNCRLIDMPDTCIGLHLKSNTFMISGSGIFTPTDTNLPATISKPTMVSGGNFVCPGKSITFKDYDQKQKLLTIDLNLNFQNFKTLDVKIDQIDQIYSNITFLSNQLSNLSETQNVSFEINNLEATLENRFYLTTGISVFSILLTLLASWPLIQKMKHLLCNSKKSKIVKFADPELMVPLKFDERVKSTPNLTKT